MTCGCNSRSIRLWRRFASYKAEERVFYLPSGVRVGWDFVRDYHIRATVILLSHLFFWRGGNPRR